MLSVSVCLSVRPVPPPRGKTKRPRKTNFVGRVPGTRAPRGPISRIPAVAGVGRPYAKASVPPPRGKTKRPTYTKLCRKGPWDTSTPGPITRSRGQRSRSRRLIALFAKNPHNFAACCPINLIFGRWRKDPLPPVPSLPWQRPFPPSVRTQLQGRPHSGRPLNGRTLLFICSFGLHFACYVPFLFKS